MATISLGSHAVFNYYRYSESTSKKEDELELVEPDHHSDGRGEKSPSGSQTEAGRGRVIDPSPSLSLLLEPRSLVITTLSLYTEHLHGIDPQTLDILAPANDNGQEPNTDTISPEEQSYSLNKNSSVHIANWRLIQDPHLREMAVKGGVLERGTRVSLTCRDVEKVVEIRKLKR